MLTPSMRELFAEELHQAELLRTPVAPLSSRPGVQISVEDAYDIQSINIHRRIADGAHLIGHKIGLTSHAMQEMMGVDTPDFGHLLNTMSLDAGREIDLSSFIQPRVEPEIAFLLSHDLPQAGCTADDVRRATGAVAPCLELIDSRIVDWNIRLTDTIADNASSAGVILGSWRPLPHDCADLDTELEIDGQIVESGSTAAVLGDPAIAVAWLANALGELGVTIEAGQTVLSGSCTRAVDVSAGNRLQARFAGFGDLVVSFS